MSWWTRKFVREWKDQVLCPCTKKRTCKIIKTTGWSASSQFLWKLQKKTPKTNPMETISKLIKVTRNNQPRIVISKSSLTILFAFSDLWMAGARWQPFIPIAVRFWHCLTCGQTGETQWLNTTLVRDWVHNHTLRIMVSGSKASWWPITSTAWLSRHVISSNIHVIFNHLHYSTHSQKSS